MQKILSALFIILMLTSFAIFEIRRKSSFYVLKVVNANEIVVDLNGNGQEDLNENITIPDIEILTSNLNKNQNNLIKKLNLSKIDAIKFGYLSDNFAENILLNKKVKIIKLGENISDISIEGNSYKNLLLRSGFGFDSNNPSNKYKKLLEKAKKLNLVILNHKSNKYHKLDCEYGNAANDTILIPFRQLPDNAVPCKYCHLNKSQNTKSFLNQIYPTVISDGAIKLYLTDLTTKLKPDKTCSHIVCKEILSQINAAKSSIDIALYGWNNNTELYTALKNAKKRNVKIRIVYDKSNNSYYPETKYILDIADEISSDNIQTLMHNKFIIFDDKTVITGSMNFSNTGFSGFNTNTLLVINNRDISLQYKTEFEQMLKGKFSNDKNKLNSKSVNFENTTIIPLFSPKDIIITNNIISIINNAKFYIYIPAFVITHQNFANSLIKAKQRGVDVKIITDATGTFSTGSKTEYLRKSGIPLKIENYAGKVHSKSIIIDDKYIITGSMNFSNSGENKNDENLLIIENHKLAKYYKGFFEYLWNKIPEKYLNQNIRAESKDSIGSCFDGIDNNYDGKIDLEDAGCK